MGKRKSRRRRRKKKKKKRLEMIAMSATREGSFRTTPDEIIQYEDEHVKLSDTELLLKMYYNNENGQNSVSILLSHIVHVAWAGSDKKPSLLTKLKQKMKKSIQKQKPIENEIGIANKNNNNEDITDVEEEGTKKEHKKHGTQFVVVASIKGSQQITGYGFSVIEDPLLFHKLIQPNHYVAIEKTAKAKADATAQAAAEEKKKQAASTTL